MMSENEHIDEDLERIVFSIVSFSGEAKNYAYQALSCSENGDFDGVNALMKKSDECISHAHAVQTDIISQEISGRKMIVSMIMVHAQDHLMTTIAERELILRMIKQNQRLFKLESLLLNMSDNQDT